LTLDLQKLGIRRVIDSQEQEFYSKLNSKYFNGINLQVFNKIESFYKANVRLPSKEEFILSKKDSSMQDYLEMEIFNDENESADVTDGFLVGQLQDYFVREETIDFLDGFIENLDNFEKVEVIDQLQSHLMKLNKAIPSSDNLMNVADIETIPSGDTFVMFNSGLSNEYDMTNGGFGLQELVLIGGRRGSGKSILLLNATLHRYLQGHTVAFMSIEMRYLEVYYRLMSSLSKVPFLNFMLGKLSDSEKYRVAMAKLQTFYKPSPKITELLDSLSKHKNMIQFDRELKNSGLELKDHRFLIIDEEDLSPNRVDYYCNMFTHNHPNFSMTTVDYLNILRVDEAMDWKSQVALAAYLKSLARKYNITLLSAYQIDASMEARFAKGILDAADRAFAFTPPEENKPWELPMFTAKIRNGKNMSFSVYMDWEIVKVVPEMSTELMEKMLRGNQYGSGTEEEPRGEVSRDV